MQWAADLALAHLSQGKFLESERPAALVSALELELGGAESRPR